VAIGPYQGATERILLEGGLVDALQVAAARKRMGRVGGTLPGSLVRMGLVPESRILDVLSRRYGIPTVPRERLRAPQPEALSLLSFDQAFLFRTLPLRKIGPLGRITLEAAVADPGVAQSLQNLPAMTALDLRLFVAPERELEKAIEGAYKKKAPSFATDASAPAATYQQTADSRPEAGAGVEGSFETVIEPVQPGAEPEVEIELTPDIQGSLAVDTAAPERPAPSPRESAALPAASPEKSAPSDSPPSKELVAVRVLIELLEKKGILTRAEFLSALKQWSEES